MIKYVLVLLTTLMILNIGNAAPEANVENTANDKYSWLSEIVTNQDAANKTPAIGVAIVGPDGVLAIHTQGFRSSKKTERISDSDLWHLGSCTKAMTALLYADLVENGKAKWGATIQDLFPELKNLIDPSWADTTIENLLDHTSGVGDISRSWLLTRRSDQRPITDQRLEDVTRIFSAPPTGNPGEFEYSNLNYILVGAAIEHITGKSWEEAFREGKPGQLLGKTGWGFGPPQGQNPIGHRSIFGFLVPMGQDWKSADNPTAMGPAGTVHASLASWAEFAAAFLNSSEQLSSETKKHLTSIHHKKGYYALGWGRNMKDENGILAHSGSNTMWFSNILVIPKKDRAILVVTNSGSPTAQKLVQNVTASVQSALNNSEQFE